MKLTTALAALLLTPLALAAQSSMPGMSMPAKPPVAPSTSLTITFNGSTTTFSIADLKALPQQTITAVDGHTGKTVTFTGPLATDVLAKAGLIPGAPTHALILHSYVTATGTDGYFVVYSGAELEPTFTSGKVIVALTTDGTPDASGLQLVNPLDVKAARWVHGLSSLIVTTLAPAK